MRGVVYGYDPDPHCEECGGEMEIDLAYDGGQANTCPHCVPDCPVCEDSGEVRHPNYGARNCPDPTIPCPNCTGRTA